jgi:hypothetical protein
MGRKLVAISMGIVAISVVATAGGLGVASAHDGNDRTGSSSGHNHGANQVNDEDSIVPLGRTCEGSDLDVHSGFQSEEAVCVETEFGEQSAFEDNPTLLIVEAPARVSVGQDIVLKVSTRNLVRDRFLAAGEGGYYLETALLNGDGLTRGHFHTGCRMLENGDEAPEPIRLDADGTNRFIATEDGKGSDDPDVVTITIEAFVETGVVQCASWAGDGTHRVPMSSFANQVPAFDVVRIEVR